MTCLYCTSHIQNFGSDSQFPIHFNRLSRHICMSGECCVWFCHQAKGITVDRRFQWPYLQMMLNNAGGQKQLPLWECVTPGEADFCLMDVLVPVPLWWWGQIGVSTAYEWAESDSTRKNRWAHCMALDSCSFSYQEINGYDSLFILFYLPDCCSCTHWNSFFSWKHCWQQQFLDNVAYIILSRFMHFLRHCCQHPTSPKRQSWVKGFQCSLSKPMDLLNPHVWLPFLQYSLRDRLISGCQCGFLIFEIIQLSTLKTPILFTSESARICA